MIRFRDTLNRSQPPAWLVGARNLHRRASTMGELWACGDALYLTDAGPWKPIGDGYEVAGPVESWDDYRRADSWFNTEDAHDMAGRAWAIPRVLDENGDRAFRVAYGADFLPELSPEQYHVLEVAKAARDAIDASTRGVQDAGVQAACRWAAELIARAYHLPVPAIAAMCILDDDLATGALSVAIGMRCEVKP